MKAQGWKKYGIGVASILVSVIAILLVSGSGTAAADQLFNVFVTNTSANPVPVSGTLTVTSPAASPLAVHEANTDANGNIKVREQGTVQVGGSVSVSNLPSTQPVSGTVDVGNFPTNFPAAPTTSVIASGVTTVAQVANVGEAVTIIPQTDVSAYREVTVYAAVNLGGGSGQLCGVATFDPSGNGYEVERFGFGAPDLQLIKTFDPAPPNFEFGCENTLDHDVQITWMLVGRSG
jgi:hypothetical protein